MTVKGKPPIASRNADSSKVQAIRPQAEAIEPPEGWGQNSEFGFLASGAGPASRLVRLAEVLRWLEQSRGLPRKAALDAMCEAMPLDVMTWLYRLRSNDYAQLVPEAETFGFKTAAQLEDIKAQHRQEALQHEWQREQGRRFSGGRFSVENGRICTTLPEPTEPGRPALLKSMGKTWPQMKWNRKATRDVLDDPRLRLTSLAIPLDKAHAAWGYGRSAAMDAVAPPASLIPAASDESGKKWTEDKLRKLLSDYQEFERSGCKAPREALAKKWGESVPNIKKRLTEARKLAKAAASPFAGLGAKASR